MEHIMASEAFWMYQQYHLYVHSVQMLSIVRAHDFRTLICGMVHPATKSAGCQSGASQFRREKMVLPRSLNTSNLFSIIFLPNVDIIELCFKKQTYLTSIGPLGFPRALLTGCQAGASGFPHFPQSFFFHNHDHPLSVFDVQQLHIHHRPSACMATWTHSRTE
jgi:hypothetical protein